MITDALSIHSWVFIDQSNNNNNNLIHSSNYNFTYRYNTYKSVKKHKYEAWRLGDQEVYVLLCSYIELTELKSE